ncbi:uncharacterized protein SAPINGB_P005577 [Magnusiomyces paraingens]|uniref:Mitochondrial peculiar membrane protein 1 n=1 Tax=Magnusiomyces paraingens TaxID=2606893 RepID=A0A5E8C7J4_9ASCO|nr:uncharacterized protein SAPINGB_P005577 [Saprochaete ingens]VVT57186.1 unnamed protein product [Saprochaete ingens]
MTNDNDKKDNIGSSASKDDSLSPISDFIDLTDKTLDRMYRNASQLYNDYQGRWSDSVDDTLSTSIPTFFRERADNFFQHNPWFSSSSDEDSGFSRLPWKWNHSRNWNSSLDVFQVEGDSESNENVGASGSLTTTTGDSLTSPQTIELDQSKPRNLWAFPVPSTRQYDNCKELQGTSLWTREGVWRCLFPKSSSDQARLDQALEKSKNADYASASNTTDPSTSSTLTETQVFSDFTTYLDWKSAVRKAIAAKRRLERAEWQKQFDSQFGDKSPQQYQSGQLTTSSPKFITEEEAKAQNKKVVSSAYSSTTVTKDDGSLETRKVIEKWYDDGTASVTEKINNSPNDGKGNDGTSGWFWK